MPSPILAISENAITLLKDRVVSELGRPTACKNDCDGLSELIEQQTKRLISVNTLRRLFDVMPSEGRPSLETLNILSAFCGFVDFHEFKRSIQINLPQPSLMVESVNDLHAALGNSPLFYQTTGHLLQLAFRDSNTTFLKSFFDLNTFQKNTDYTETELKKVLMCFGTGLRANPKLFDELTGHYAAHAIAQSLYFEFFVDYDFLTIRHHKAMRSYAQNKKQTEAKLFSSCLLFLHSFLLRDRNACTALIKEINDIEVSDNLHPFPVGRRMACAILFQHFYLGSVKKSLLAEVFELERAMPRQGTLGRAVPHYHCVVAEAFNWCGLHEEAALLMELAIGSYKPEVSYYSSSFLSIVDMTYAEALLKTNRTEEARLVFQKADASLFTERDKNFYTMHHHKLSAEMHKQHNPKLAASFKRSAREIAVNHKFKFFEGTL
jgi:hypothetical protein